MEKKKKKKNTIFHRTLFITVPISFCWAKTNVLSKRGLQLKAFVLQNKMIIIIICDYQEGFKGTSSRESIYFQTSKCNEILKLLLWKIPST